MKRLLIIATACTMLVGCQEGHRAPNHYYGEMTYKENTTQEKTQKPKYTQLPNDMLVKTHREFDGYTLYEHKDNRTKSPRNGFGAIFIRRDKDFSPRELSTSLVASYRGARRIKVFKLIIDGTAYQCYPDDSRKLADGRIVAFKNHHMDIDNFIEPLAFADSARLLIQFDNGEQEYHLTKEDLQYYSGMVQTFLSMGGMTNF